MSTPMVPCTEHNTSGWCYLQDDWSHMDADLCACGVHPVSWCRVDAHRHAAEDFRDDRNEPNTLTLTFGRSDSLGSN